MRLLRFLDFIIEAASDVLLPFRVSSEFEQKLDEIDSAIASKLTGVIRIKQLSKFTLVTVSEDGNIEYSDSYRVDEFKKKQMGNSDYPTSNWLKSFVPNPSDEVYSYRRVNIGVGRFINRIFPNEFTSAEVEDFVNKWRAVNEVQPTFELWSGYEIRRGYTSNDYHFTDTNMNTLMNSCMNDQFDCIEMYEYCTDLRLLVLLNDENHILGRALIWKDYQGRYIMDRVYYVYDSDYHKFVKYAKQNGWWYKKRNVSGGSSFIRGDKEMSLDTKVRVPNVFDAEYRGDKFPYMDTFFYAQGEWAYNNPPDEGRYLKLNDTEGGFEIVSNQYDIHGQEIIDERYYVISKEQEGYIWKDDAIHIQYDGGQGFEQYKYDDWLEKSYVEDKRNGFINLDGKWYKEKHCVWSDKEQSWIWRPDAVWVGKDYVSYDNFNPQKK
jgi:hypothetical protein